MSASPGPALALPSTRSPPPIERERDVLPTHHAHPPAAPPPPEQPLLPPPPSALPSLQGLADMSPTHSFHLPTPIAANPATDPDPDPDPAPARAPATPQPHRSVSPMNVDVPPRTTDGSASADVNADAVPAATSIDDARASPMMLQHDGSVAPAPTPAPAPDPASKFEPEP